MSSHWVAPAGVMILARRSSRVIARRGRTSSTALGGIVHSSGFCRGRRRTAAVGTDTGSRPSFISVPICSTVQREVGCEVPCHSDEGVEPRADTHASPRPGARAG